MQEPRVSQSLVGLQGEILLQEVLLFVILNLHLQLLIKVVVDLALLGHRWYVLGESTFHIVGPVHLFSLDDQLPLLDLTILKRIEGDDELCAVSTEGFQ